MITLIKILSNSLENEEPVNFTKEEIKFLKTILIKYPNIIIRMQEDMDRLTLENPIEAIDIPDIILLIYNILIENIVEFPVDITNIIEYIVDNIIEAYANLCDLDLIILENIKLGSFRLLRTKVPLKIIKEELTIDSYFKSLLKFFCFF